MSVEKLDWDSISIDWLENSKERGDSGVVQNGTMPPFVKEFIESQIYSELEKVDGVISWELIEPEA